MLPTDPNPWYQYLFTDGTICNGGSNTCSLGSCSVRPRRCNVDSADACAAIDLQHLQLDRRHRSDPTAVVPSQLVCHHNITASTHTAQLQCDAVHGGHIERRGRLHCGLLLCQGRGLRHADRLRLDAARQIARPAPHRTLTHHSPIHTGVKAAFVAAGQSCNNYNGICTGTGSCVSATDTHLSSYLSGQLLDWIVTYWCLQHCDGLH